VNISTSFFSRFCSLSDYWQCRFNGAFLHKVTQVPCFNNIAVTCRLQYALYSKMNRNTARLSALLSDTSENSNNNKRCRSGILHPILEFSKI